MSTLNASLSLMMLVGLCPHQDVTSERVDLVEVNHYFDDQGKSVFDQVIFYEWSPLHGRFHVRTWRPLESASQLPQRDLKTGEYFAVWQDPHDGNRLREVRAPVVRETWTQYDPELLNRKYVPRSERRDLARISSAKLR